MAVVSESRGLLAHLMEGEPGHRAPGILRFSRRVLSLQPRGRPNLLVSRSDRT